MVATQRFIAPRGIDALLALFKTTAIDANEHIRFAESSSDSAIRLELDQAIRQGGSPLC